MSISNDTIDKIRMSVDIIALIREYVPGLKKAGRNWKANCPFHHEKTPSFMVSPEKGIFHCFGCHAGGDVFKFVMQIDNLTWPEAVRKLAARSGIAIEEEKGYSITRSEKQKVFDLLENAAEFYHRCLKELPDASKAREYLKKRGISENSIKKFRIGYSPKGLLLASATKKGFSPDDIMKAGLVTRTEKGNIFEYMSGRLVFPIYDTQGRVVAFGGRTLSNEQPKYINSPETIVFSKSHQLYGLYQALQTVRESREVIVLEGYTDVVVTHQYEVSNSVATLGTSLSSQHAQTLHRYAEKVTLLFDSDDAGKKAALRAIDVLLEIDIPIKVLHLPHGLDPDEFVIKEGKAGLMGYIEKNAKSAFAYLTEFYISRYGNDTPHVKAKIVSDLLPLIRKIKNEIIAQEWIKFIAQEVHIAEESLRSELRKVKDKKYRPQESEKKCLKVLRTTEEEILQIIAHYPHCRQLVPENTFRNERNQKVYALLADNVSVSDIAGQLPELELGWFTELIVEDRTYVSPEQVLMNLIKGIKQKGLEEERKKLEEEIVLMLDGEKPIDQDKMQLYQELNKQLKGSLK